jgi:hypothetical protein
VYQAFNNVLPMANLPVTLEDGSELVITADDVQLYKVGSGATTNFIMARERTPISEINALSRSDRDRGACPARSK